MLPLTDLIVFPDTLRRLTLPRDASITGTEPLPGLGVTLPPLVTQGFIIGPLPYVAASANIRPLYSGEFTFLTRSGNEGIWTGPSTLASISADQRVGLFALPLINEQSGSAPADEPGGRPCRRH